jgi:hypothetical protein
MYNPSYVSLFSFWEIIIFIITITIIIILLFHPATPQK